MTLVLDESGVHGGVEWTMFGTISLVVYVLLALLVCRTIDIERYHNF